MFGFGPNISKAVAAKPDGLLLHEPVFFSFFPIHVGMRHWWQKFLRDSGGTGFWHETYFMRGGIEAIYDDMPKPIGLSEFAPVVEARGPMFLGQKMTKPGGRP